MKILNDLRVGASKEINQQIDRLLENLYAKYRLEPATIISNLRRTPTTAEELVIGLINVQQELFNIYKAH